MNGLSTDAARRSGLHARRLSVGALATLAVSLCGASHGAQHRVPLLVSPDSNREGFVRIINHSDEGGDVQIVGIDDAGREFGPAYLRLRSLGAAHVSASQLERGSAAKGLEGIDVQGDATGHWRLRLETTLDIEPLAYVRTRTGYVTPVDGFVRPPGAHVEFHTTLHPGSELRVINLDRQPASATVVPVVEGKGFGHEFPVGPGAAVRLLPEDFPPGLFWAGHSGKLMSVRTHADSHLAVMNLVQSSAGDLGNLSRQPRGQTAVPFFPAKGQRAGVIDVINRSGGRGMVEVHATDDAGRRRGPVTFELLPNARARFDSTDLEQGNPRKGLNGSLGDGSGDWRLRVSSELAIDLETYARRADGVLTAIHGTAPRVGHSHRIPFFNPGSNWKQASVLRLINPGDATARVTVSGRDDQGLAGGEVRLSLSPGTARNVSARELESGGEDLSGSLGDGAGKWRLAINADRPLEAIALLGGPNGHLSNVSSAAAGRFTKPLERHNVMLRVVRVTPDWVPFSNADGWTMAVRTKESAHLRYFEAAIWDETGTVVLYEFPNDYQRLYTTNFRTYATTFGIPDARVGELSVAYREQFRLAEFPIPEPEDDGRSQALLDAFKAIADILVARYPGSAHHLSYAGHGAPGGLLFEKQMSVAHADELLAHWTMKLGSKLGVIDMGGPCNKGSLEDLRNFCPHASFYIGSDLPNGGFGEAGAELSQEEHEETEWDAQYPRLFDTHADLGTVLRERVNLRRMLYERSRQNMIDGKVEQANYVYSCSAALDFMEPFDEFQNGLPEERARLHDLYLHLKRNEAPESLLQGFRDIIAHGVNNRDFFEWEVDANGIACVECSAD